MQKPDDHEIASQLRSPHGENAIPIGEFMAKGNAGLYHKLFSLLHPRPAESILEIGPGNGSFVSGMIKPDDHFTYTAIDMSLEMVTEAKVCNAELISLGKAGFIHGNFMEYSFNSVKFDHIIGVNVIYFMNPFLDFLKSVRSVMNEDSMLYLGYRRRESMIQLPFTKYGFQLYEADEVETALEREGFRNIKSTRFQEELKTPDGVNLQLENIFTLASIS